MFKKGDGYIQFTKYGGVNVGTVRQYMEVYLFDEVNKITYIRPHIVTDANILLELDGTDGPIYKIKSDKKSVQADVMMSKLRKKDESNS